MSCDLTSGRKEPCKNLQGGLKTAIFIDYKPDAFTVANGQATAINPTVTVAYAWPLRSNNNNLSEAMVSDRNTGTTVNTQTTNLRFKKQDYQTSNEIKLMAYARPIIVAEQTSGRHILIGRSEGNDLTGSNIQTGGAKSDFNGYDLTFTAEEMDLAPELDAATVTALKGIISATVIDPDAP